jgi:Trypsin
MQNTLTCLFVSLSLLMSCRAEVVEVAKSTSQAIANGTLTEPSAHPSAFALITFSPTLGGGPFCSSVLVASDALLTAAHCVQQFAGWRGQGYEIYATNAATVTELEVLPEGAIRVVGSTEHPDYSEQQWANDIGLVFLEHAPANVAPAPLLTRDEEAHVREGESMVVVGWGRTERISLHGIMREGAMKIQYATERVILSGVALRDEPYVSSCGQDSGGPAFLIGNDGLRLVGVQAQAPVNCNTFNLLVRPDHFRSFINAGLSRACTEGVRTACDVPGLPSLAQLGAAPLSSPAGELRHIPDVVREGLRAASETDVDAVTAFLSCAVDGGCTNSCVSLFNAARQATSLCGDQITIVDKIYGNDAIAPEVLEIFERFCEAAEQCTEESADSCLIRWRDEMLFWSLSGGCNRLMLRLDEVMSTCGIESWCANINVSVCAVTQASIANDKRRCDDVADLHDFVPGGEGEGEGEGDAGPPPSCAHASHAIGVILSGLMLRRRSRS